jgi:hypothetical protein
MGLLSVGAGSGGTSSSSFFAPCSIVFGLTGRDVSVPEDACCECAGAPIESIGISSTEDEKVEALLQRPVEVDGLEVIGLAGS